MATESHTETQAGNLPGIDLPPVEAEYRAGGGHEWPSKIRSVRGSAALTVNLFVPLRQIARSGTPPDAPLACGAVDWAGMRIEEQFPTGAMTRSGPVRANLDAYFDAASDGLYDSVAVEVKATEYFSQKGKPPSEQYDGLAHLMSDPAWSAALRMLRGGERTHLDRKQLLTHAAGLLKRRESLPSGTPPTALLALFWVPADAAAVPACRAVLREAADWGDLTVSSGVRLLFATVDQVVAGWLASPDERVRSHAVNVAARYCGIRAA